MDPWVWFSLAISHSLTSDWTTNENLFRSLRNHRSVMGGSNVNHTILSMDLNQYENEITIGKALTVRENYFNAWGIFNSETDIPSYTSFQYISDVGGTAGLGRFLNLDREDFGSRCSVIRRPHPRSSQFFSGIEVLGRPRPCLKPWKCLVYLSHH